jgi:hypothetical protein
MLSVVTRPQYAECRYAECRYVECHYSECRYAECRYAECRYSECRYAECRGANFLPQKLFSLPIAFLCKQWLFSNPRTDYL